MDIRKVSLSIYLSLYDRVTGQFRLEDPSTWSKPLLRAGANSGLPQTTEDFLLLSFKPIQG